MERVAYPNQDSGDTEVSVQKGPRPLGPKVDMAKPLGPDFVFNVSD